MLRSVTNLALLELNDLALEAHALALVRLRRTLLADVGDKVAQLLLVVPRHHHSCVLLNLCVKFGCSTAQREGAVDGWCCTSQSTSCVHQQEVCAVQSDTWSLSCWIKDRCSSNKTNSCQTCGPFYVCQVSHLSMFSWQWPKCQRMGHNKAYNACQ